MDKEALNRDLFDLLLQHAVEDLNAEDEIAAAKEIDSYSDMPDHEFSANFQFNMKKLMKRSKRYQNATPHRRIRNMIGLVAALISMFTFALVVAQAAGFNIFEFLFYSTSEYSSFDQVESLTDEFIAQLNAQEDYKGPYFFLKNIPDGLVLSDVSFTDESCRIMFDSLDAKKRITLYQMYIKGNGLSFMYDSEQAEQKRIKINGFDAYIVKKESCITIGYSNDEAYFNFMFTGFTEEDAIRTASDLKKILE